MTEYLVGGIYKDKKRNPTSVFVIHEILYTAFTTRVRGTLVSDNQYVDSCREMDMRSLIKMYPYLMFSPSIYKDERTHK